MNNSVFLVKKTAVITLITFCLWGQVVNNLYLDFPSLFVDLKQLASFLGTGTYWQMFSRADRHNWRMEWLAIHADQATSLLPLPYQTKDNFFAENFIEFREGKLNQNLFKYADLRRNYADYLCRVAQDPQNPIIEIRVDLYWQEILPPQQAKLEDKYLSKGVIETGKLGVFPCH